MPSSPPWATIPHADACSLVHERTLISTSIIHPGLGKVVGRRHRSRKRDCGLGCNTRALLARSPVSGRSQCCRPAALQPVVMSWTIHIRCKVLQLELNKRGPTGSPLYERIGAATAGCSLFFRQGFNLWGFFRCTTAHPWNRDRANTQGRKMVGNRARILPQSGTRATLYQMNTKVKGIALESTRRGNECRLGCCTLVDDEDNRDS